MSFTVTPAEFAASAVKVAKLNARAAKAGIAAAATLTEISRETRTEATEFGFDRTYTVVTAEITGVEAVTLGEWTLAAVIDHDVAGNIFRTVPGFPVEIPASFRATAASRCDHCNAVRNRTNTILVWSVAEGFKQVGSDCVKLFLGVSVASLIAFISDIEEASSESEGGWGGKHEYNTHEFLAAAAFVTETYGFKPASFDSQATKRIAFDLISLTGSALKDFAKKCPELFAADEKVIARANLLASEAAAWITEADTNGNEYLLNLKIAAARDEVGKNAGLLASLPNACKRALGQIAERAAKAEKAAESVHVGTVGQKVTTTATVVYTNRTAAYSYYGPEGLFLILVGTDGNTFYVNTTVDTAIGALLEDAARGAQFTVTGTVKDHKVTDKGQAVTVLTRCKAQEV